MALKERMTIADSVTIEIHRTRYVREQDGAVAVILYTGPAGGWSTSNPQYPELAFDPVIVEFILNEQRDKIIPYCNVKYPGGDFDSAYELVLSWVSPQSRFVIAETDGYERVRLEESFHWLQA